jgi:hypothetical protein
MNNENTNETRFNWTIGRWPAYCTTIQNGTVVGRVTRKDDGLLDAEAFKDISRGFETIGYYIDLEHAQAAIERWVTDNQEWLVTNTGQETQGQEAHDKTKRWTVGMNVAGEWWLYETGTNVVTRLLRLNGPEYRDLADQIAYLINGVRS